MYVISTHKHTEEVPKRSRDRLFTPEVKNCFDCYSFIGLMRPMYLHYPALGTLVLILGTKSFANFGKCGLV